MSALTLVMATCHSLALIDGHVVGDPVDVEMFSFTKWELLEPEEGEENCTGIVRPRGGVRRNKSGGY